MRFAAVDIFLPGVLFVWASIALLVATNLLRAGRRDLRKFVRGSSLREATQSLASRDDDDVARLAAFLAQSSGMHSEFSKSTYALIGRTKKKTSSMVFMLKVLLIGGIRRQGQAFSRQCC
jgi:hypothetical protein